MLTHREAQGLHEATPVACLQLLLCPLSKSHYFIVSSIFFLHLLLGTTLPLCPCEFLLKACFSTEEESFLIVGPIYCHFRSYICAVSALSRAHLHKSSLQVMLSQKTFKIFYSTCIFIIIIIIIKLFFDKSIFCPKTYSHFVLLPVNENVVMT